MSSLLPQGIYPTLIIVFVKLQKSVWDATEVSKSVRSQLKFAGPDYSTSQETETVTGTHMTVTGTNKYAEDVDSGTAHEKRTGMVTFEA